MAKSLKRLDGSLVIKTWVVINLLFGAQMPALLLAQERERVAPQVVIGAGYSGFGPMIALDVEALRSPRIFAGIATAISTDQQVHLEAGLMSPVSETTSKTRPYVGGGLAVRIDRNRAAAGLIRMGVERTLPSAALRLELRAYLGGGSAFAVMGCFASPLPWNRRL